MRYLYSLFVSMLCFTASLWAQPVNDECSGAILITDVDNWCSAQLAFNNVNATQSPEANPGCFPTNQANEDVWFTFVAEATTVSIAVIGDIPYTPGGTLDDPQLALYSGSCGNLTEVECFSDAFNVNAAQTYAGPLTVGEQYYIRVGARNGANGSFRLCVNNYNQVPEPSGDCPTGVILCDKSPFTVQYVVGQGSNPNEIDGTGCDNTTCKFTESSSSWYKWTCDQSGSLTFTLTPLNPNDDIDFVLYELPNGINNCSGKFDLRCMASGENINSPFSEWQICTGATGLSLTDPDVNETCGCQAGNNNFLKAVDMVQGKSYALVINNYSNSGAGFTVSFGGSGTFLGPTADFSAAPTTICVGESITFTDQSSFVGQIVGWEWNFGPGSTPRTATTRGPHTVRFDQPGRKSVVLTVETDGGCLVTDILTIEVECCEDHFTASADISTLNCPDDQTGAIDFSVDSGYSPYFFNWSSGQTTEDISGLGAGMYTVAVRDNVGCTDTLTYEVTSPPPFSFDTLIVMPTCNGGTDGRVELVVTGGTPPYQFNWQNAGFGPDNFLDNISQGNYAVVIRDANGCEIPMDLAVRELELVLDPTVEAVTPPTCFGFSNGFINLDIANGLGPFQYDWNDGAGYVDESSLTGLTSGFYTVDVLDANLCKGHFEFQIEDYPQLTLALDQMNVSCNGLSDGSASAAVGGGVGSYAYQWSNSGATPEIDNLSAGNYAITVLDGNNCEITGSVEITQPEPVLVDVIDIIDNICFGASDGAITVEGSGGTSPYEFSLDGESFQSSPVFGNLPAGDYTITIRDLEGCEGTTQAAVDQPVELLVDAGPDQFIQLGYETTVHAVASNPLVSYAWSPQDSLRCIGADPCSNVLVNPVNTTTYQVTIVDETGCEATDEVTIHVIKDRPVYIPNGFTPDGDGINDGFTVFGGPAVDRIQELKIFDRWGELVFDTKNIPPSNEGLGWDGTFNGKTVNPGVFVYLAEVRFIDGEVETYSGDVTLVR